MQKRKVFNKLLEKLCEFFQKLLMSNYTYRILADKKSRQLRKLLQVFS